MFKVSFIWYKNKYPVYECQHDIANVVLSIISNRVLYNTSQLYRFYYFIEKQFVNYVHILWRRTRDFRMRKDFQTYFSKPTQYLWRKCVAKARYL